MEKRLSLKKLEGQLRKELKKNPSFRKEDVEHLVKDAIKRLRKMRRDAK